MMQLTEELIQVILQNKDDKKFPIDIDKWIDYNSILEIGVINVYECFLFDLPDNYEVLPCIEMTCLFSIKQYIKLLPIKGFIACEDNLLNRAGLNTLVKSCLKAIRLKPLETGKKILGYIYLITDGEAVKVGYSESPGFRLKQLQTAHSKPLTLLATVNSYLSTEQKFHSKYKKQSLSGEWYPLEMLPQIQAELNIKKLLKGQVSDKEKMNRRSAQPFEGS